MKNLALTVIVKAPDDMPEDRVAQLVGKCVEVGYADAMETVEGDSHDRKNDADALSEMEIVRTECNPDYPFRDSQGEAPKREPASEFGITCSGPAFRHRPDLGDEPDWVAKLAGLMGAGLLKVPVRFDALIYAVQLGRTRLAKYGFEVLETGNYSALLSLLNTERAIAEQIFPEAPPTVPEYMREAPEWVLACPVVGGPPKV